MDNHPFGSPYPYGSYGYPPHPQVPPHPHQPYPPTYPQPHQPYPPPQQPYPPPQQPYPPASSTQYPPSAPAPNPYPPYPHYPPPPSYSTPPTDSYSSAPSAPPAFSHEPPPPPHEHQHSHSGSFSYPNQGYPVLEQQNSLKYETMPTPDSFHRHNSSVSLHSSSVNYGDSKIQSYPSVYPPIDYLLENVHLSSNEPSPSVSEVPKPTVKYHSGPLPGRTGYNGHQGTIFGQHHNHNHSFNSQGTMYGYTNSSFSSYESSPSRVQSSSPSPNRLSLDIIPSNHALGIVPVSPKGSLKVLLLHGNLDIWVCEAKNLPNMDMFHKTLGDVLNKLPGNMTGKIEGHMNHKITSDPYVTITLCDAAVGRTYVISNDENPVWMQHFNVPVAHYAAEIHFLVKDNDVVGSQLIGIVAIPVENIFNGERLDGFYPIIGPNGKPCKPGAVLRVSIQYAPIEKLSIYHHGVGAGPDYTGVPGTYFPLRKGGRVTLYQDAHVPDGYLPSLKLGYGMDYVHGKCWHDIFDAIRQARRLIYITGWSVWHKVRLIRDENPLSGHALGELLKAKSQEGVRVLLLVWDDPTSRNIMGYKTNGVMATHDEETRRFFKHSSVQVQLCPRAAGKRTSWYKQTEVGVIYTHHQKTVIVDADAGNNMRRIVSFVGGLDLCDGRYDTPNHSLFRTLETLHADDYHNPTFTGITAGCPREPWHDLHCKIDGPAAYDVLENFERRWLKASKPHGIKSKLKGSNDDSLLRIERMPDILGAADTPCITENDPECWHVQVFRSIDSNSVKGFPKDPKNATHENLMCGKNVLIDMSIHTAYVKAIRAAQHFIYIENQYFIGSSYNWGTYKDVGANNLIPMEIALKIVEKIKAHERFAVYIVVPMWPEGNPTGKATQRILFWQHKTMQMMYETIYKALVEMGVEDTFTPEDYLNFYCLGNREALDNSSNGNGTTTNYAAAASAENQGSSTNTNTHTPQALSRKSRRFMIYVHSKGMIVDDEYVILGSANINQRSMEGTRDTEIAMGGYQPHHTWARHSASPRGQIYGYRMSLWAEHLGVIEDCFTQPESLECVRRTRSMGETNWKQFASPEVTEMSGHLCKYPVEVDRTGKVKSLPGHETFPDVGGNIIGSFLVIQENLTI